MRIWGIAAAAVAVSMALVGPSFAGGGAAGQPSMKTPIRSGGGVTVAPNLLSCTMYYAKDAAGAQPYSGNPSTIVNAVQGGSVWLFASVKNHSANAKVPGAQLQTKVLNASYINPVGGVQANSQLLNKIVAQLDSIKLNNTVDLDKNQTKNVKLGEFKFWPLWESWAKGSAKHFASVKWNVQTFLPVSGKTCDGPAMTLQYDNLP